MVPSRLPLCSEGLLYGATSQTPVREITLKSLGLLPNSQFRFDLFSSGLWRQLARYHIECIVFTVFPLQQ
eukprot:scaffold612190_cov39-Prasinocladus_malaysianus.AAC.1